MPIYEYACPDCGYQNDHMQKLADAPIKACPKCNSDKYFKKISAAGFALKGSGWYVTDFRNGGSNTSGKPATDSAAVSPAPATTTPSTTPAAAPAPAPAPAPAASASSGGYK